MIVVDTSVALKWVVAEDRRTAARQVLASGKMLHAPELMVLEAANTLRKKLRTKQIGLDQMTAGLAFIRQSVGVLPMGGYFDDATALSAELDHSIYDCCFLACARQIGSLFVTDDLVFLRKCETSRYGEQVLGLSEVGDGGLERALLRVPHIVSFSSREAD